jgi:ATP-binding cassette subfamily B (MDR/TAP) protein 1
MGRYQRKMLEYTAENGTLAEEVISSVRNAHAFGTQHKLKKLYDVLNVRTMKLGVKSGILLASFFSVISFW